MDFAEYNQEIVKKERAKMAQRGLPDPNEPRNRDFYREAEEYLVKRYGPGKQWSLGDLQKIVENFSVGGVPARVPKATPSPGPFLDKFLSGLQRPGVAVPYSGPLPAHYAPKRPEPELIAGPIIAWRLWKIRQDGILLSVAHSSVAWPTGAPLEGTYEGDASWGRGLVGSTAGVYAMKTRELLAGHTYGRDCLVGQVALWGRVVEHEKGYRAQWAYPTMVDLSVKEPMPGFPKPKRRSDLARMIRDNYGCEVRE